MVLSFIDLLADLELMMHVEWSDDDNVNENGIFKKFT